MNGNAIILLIILIVLFIALIYFMINNKKNKKQFHEQRQEFHEYKQEIAQQEIAKKETSKRRYITQNLKNFVLQRDNETCQICGISKQFLNNYVQGLGDYLLLEIDHIVPVAKGGSSDNENNLQVLCWRCNRKKGKSKTNIDVSNTINYGIKYLDTSEQNNKGEKQ